MDEACDGGKESRKYILSKFIIMIRIVLLLKVAEEFSNGPFSFET